MGVRQRPPPRPRSRPGGPGQSTGPQAGSHLYRVTSDPQQLRYSFHHKTQEYCDKHSENQLACIFSHAFSIDNVFNVLKARTTKQVIKLANCSFLKHGFTVMKSTCFPPWTVSTKHGKYSYQLGWGGTWERGSGWGGDTCIPDVSCWCMAKTITIL